MKKNHIEGGKDKSIEEKDSQVKAQE